MPYEIRPIPGYPHYFADNDGNILSDWRGPCPAKLTGYRDRDGYRQVCISHGSSQSSERVHHLVLAAFVGPRLPGAECDHIDGDTSNNRPENLRWVSRTENEHYKYARLGGPPVSGERHHRARLNWAKVDEILLRVSRGESHRKLAAEYGVCLRTLQKVVYRKSWKHRGVIA